MRKDGSVNDVVTGEAVALDLQVAQFPSRALAAFLDMLVLIGLMWAASLLLFALLASGETDSALAVAVNLVVLLLVLLGYPVLFETLTRGRTLGKMALGLRVVRDDGGPITFRQALIRGLMGVVFERPGLLLLGFGTSIAILVMMLSSRAKRLGDMMAGTVVLQERVAVRAGIVPPMPPPLVGWAATLDLTDMDDRLALNVRRYLARLGQLNPAAQVTVGERLAAQVAAKTTPPAPPGTPTWAYLAAVLAERRRREDGRFAALLAQQNLRQAARTVATPPPGTPAPVPAAVRADTGFLAPS
jgi:uncharacterized RDD family membrane protein YckC